MTFNFKTKQSQYLRLQKIPQESPWNDFVGDLISGPIFLFPYSSILRTFLISLMINITLHNNFPTTATLDDFVLYGYHFVTAEQLCICWNFYYVLCFMLSSRWFLDKKATQHELGNMDWIYLAVQWCLTANLFWILIISKTSTLLSWSIKPSTNLGILRNRLSRPVMRGGRNPYKYRQFLTNNHQFQTQFNLANKHNKSSKCSRL